MSNATKDIKTDEALGLLLAFPVAASTTLYAGTFGATDSSGNAISTLTASSKIWGRVERQVDNSSGSAGDKTVEVKRGRFYFDNDTTNAVANSTPRGAYVFAVDNHTVGTSDLGGTLPLAGYVIDVPASGSPEYGKVLVAVGQARPDALDPELSASSTAFRARNVATNLAALTFTGGTFLANANGALGAQDGVTNVAGDIIMIPAGTITTGVVSAANSGPWLLTSVGGSGKFSGIRPDWWPHGGTTVPGSAINVGGEGTLFGGTRWPTFSAAVVIGTSDPALYPEEVTQTVTLTSSAKAITNVPIRAAGSQVLCRLSAVGGTTTSTVGYGTLVDPTPGGIGTATTTVNALASGMTKNGTSDTSNVTVTILN